MRNLFALTAALLFLILIAPMPAFTQSGVARISGTIDDATGAVLPGVTVTATNNATGIVRTVLSNEAGAYNFASLMPGVYKVSAQLPGFQTKTYSDVQLGNDQQIRLNFTLSLSSVGTSVDVTVAVDTLLATSSSSVGSVLSEQRVQDLPIVGNNVMGLLDTLPGTRMDANGVTGTFAGLFVRSVNVTRDGMESSGAARNMQAGMTPSTYMSPDLIGEMRLIVAPVDAEMGRGNGQMQVFTRSGTNQFSGSAVWSVRNSALDANTWANNRAVDPRTGAWKPTPKDWINRNQYTGSLGGPIVKNKTFFFALWDGMIVNERLVQNPTVLTPCARNGIFRYFDTWNNGNAFQVTQATGTTPTIAVVDGVGNPLRPATNPERTRTRRPTRLPALSGTRAYSVRCRTRPYQSGLFRRRGAGRALGHKPEGHGFDRICEQAPGQDAAAEQLRDRRWLEYGGLPVGSRVRGGNEGIFAIWRDRRRAQADQRQAGSQLQRVAQGRRQPTPMNGPPAVRT